MPATTQRRTAQAATKPLSKRKERSLKLKERLGTPLDAKNPVGKPPSLLCDDATIEKIKGLGKINATNAEAAAFLDVSRETFEQFLGKHQKAEDAFENGKGSGKISLRRAQFKAALDGNATMLVWMGKQLLDQKDKSEIDNRVRFSFDEMSAEDLREYVYREAKELGVGYATSQVPRGKGKASGAGWPAALH